MLEAAAPQVRVVNLETSITRSADAAPGKAVLYRMDLANVACLAAARPDVCAADDGLPLRLGALKELGALARILPGRRAPLVRRAVDAGVAFLFSRDPAVADYPTVWGNTKPNATCFRPGFPLGYVSDVLQTLEVLAELGHGRDRRLAHALAWLEAGQNTDGRWANRYAYNGKTWVDFERQAQPSKWVTLRACTVLRAAYGVTPYHSKPPARRHSGDEQPGRPERAGDAAERDKQGMTSAVAPALPQVVIDHVEGVAGGRQLSSNWLARYAKRVAEVRCVV